MMMMMMMMMTRMMAMMMIMMMMMMMIDVDAMHQWSAAFSPLMFFFLLTQHWFVLFVLQLSIIMIINIAMIVMIFMMVIDDHDYWDGFNHHDYNDIKCIFISCSHFDIDSDLYRLCSNDEHGDCHDNNHDISTRSRAEMYHTATL